MKQLRVVICDDEPLAVEWLQRMLGQLRHTKALDSFSTGDQLLRQIGALAADVVLLDIEMPRLDGFGVVDALSRMNWDKAREPPLIIFVTAHSEFAMKAFDSGALDFIGKPVRFSRLERALQRARVATECRQARGRLRELTDQLEDLKRIHSGLSEEPHVWVQRGTEITRLDVSRIDWISAEGEYVRFHSSNSSYLERGSITDVAERFGPLGFVRIHRSTVVNAREIESLKRTRWGSLQVRLRSGAELRVSKSYQPAVRRLAVSGTRPAEHPSESG